MQRPWLQPCIWSSPRRLDSHPQPSPLGRHLQKPVHGHQQADVLRRQAHSRQDEEHGDEARTGDTGCSDAGQRCREAERTEKTGSGEEKEDLARPTLASIFPAVIKFLLFLKEQSNLECQHPGIRVFLDSMQLWWKFINSGIVAVCLAGEPISLTYHRAQLR